LIAAGIDWLTLTSVSRETQKEMGRFFGSIVAEDLQLGYKVVPGGAYGFYGKRCRHALLAAKEDRQMLQVSGKRAQRSILLCRPGDNATRLDIQATVHLGGQSVHEFLEEQHARARSAPKGKGRPASVSAVVVDGKIQTLYIGKRSSDVFIRLYDKGAESGEPAYQGCVRFEVELKGKTSKALWTHIGETAQGTMYLLRVLVHLLEGKNIDTSPIEIPREAVEMPEKQTTAESVSLAWLATQVAPTVARLSPTLGWQTLFHVLFRGACSEYDRTAIMNAFSVVWGT
jgi:hypothetical protein